MKNRKPTICFTVAMDMSLQDQFFNAAKNGHLDVVQLLLEDPRVDPSANHNLAIRLAALYGRHQIVKLLFTDPRVDPSDKLIHNSAIRLAARNGHLKVVKLLLEDPRVDPSNDHNREIVKLLLTDPRVYSNNKPIIAIESLKINVILLFLM